MPTTTLRRAATIAGLLLATNVAPAGAASPPVTGQATTADAAFLAYAPPPPHGAGALCLVDTGVNTHPDTTPGLVSATALDGGTGSDVDPLGHGTVDAAIAGGAGHGVLGAWPQLKIVSIRATDIPSPGQEPSFEFDDYIKGIGQCTEPTPGGIRAEAIDLPLQSTIQPSPDQTAAFAAAVAKAQAQGISILAAAGNKPGAIELPASEPGIFAVGGDQVAGKVYDPNPAGICSDSATTGLTFYGPGCGIDTIDPITDAPLCCGNGTSQASAFTAGVLVALRSYDPSLTPGKAVQLLLSTTTGGHLDVAAAFRADGLGAIVDAGNAAIPAPPLVPAQPAPTSTSTTTPATPGSAPVAPRVVPRPLVKSVTWRHGVLRIALKSIPKGAVLHVKATFPGHKTLYLKTAHTSLTRRTKRPTRAMLHLTEGTASSATVSINP
jgi:hypothetical protein